MESLFDVDKPSFEAWLTLYDMDTRPHYPSAFSACIPNVKSPTVPLYYAALCGFHGLVEHLVVNYPQDVNADGGYYMRPLIAALAGEHSQTADSLRRSGADPRVQNEYQITPLHSAAYYGTFEAVQKLIEYEADIDARDKDGYTPLSVASRGRHCKGGSVVRLLLDRGADVNSRADKDGTTPLHEASGNGALEVVRVLLEHGADVEAVNGDGKTPLQVVGEEPHIDGEVEQGRCDEIRRLLVEHGAK
jgi:ankyrin repeat protein